MNDKKFNRHEKAREATKRLAKSIRNLLKDYHITQEEFAGQCEICDNTLKNILRAKSDPRLSTLIGIIYGFNSVTKEPPKKRRRSRRKTALR